MFLGLASEGFFGMGFRVYHGETPAQKMSISEIGCSYQHHKVDGFVSSFPTW